MKKVKCDNGHFFDADRFSVCPICGSESFEELSTSEKKSTGTSKNTKALFALDGSVPHMSDSDGLNPPASSELIENIPAFEDPPLPPQDDSAPSTGTLLFSHEAKTPADLTQVDISQEVKPEEPLGAGALEAAVEATNSKKTTALLKTMAYYDFNEVEPPVGWLVCVVGFYAGQAFQCKAGRNRIGRNLDMDIRLSEDPSISRDTHAIIIYDPKKRTFHLQVGTNGGLTYHNGNLLFDHDELHAYDTIELRDTKFIFLPLCGEQFTWDDYTKKD